MITKDFLMDNNINEDSKLLIGIGDSFCAGTGSEDIKYWEKNNWDIEKMRFDKDAIKNAYKNSFINKICEKYLLDYTPLNLSMSGKGNRFSIRELFINPTLNLEIAKEKIIIYVVTGFERFDVSHNIGDISNHMRTLWPSYEDKNIIGYGQVEDELGEKVFSEKMMISEFIIDFIILTNWCKLNNAKLLFISGFTPTLNKEYFMNTLLGDKVLDNQVEIISRLVAKIPWHRQIKPNGYDSMIDLLLHLENKDELIPNYGFRNFNIDKQSEHGWISKCQHPTEKSQNLFADIIYEYIKNYDTVDNPDFYIENKKYIKGSVTKSKSIF